MFSGKFCLFVECCWFNSGGQIQTQNNSNIEIGEAQIITKDFLI